MRSIKGFLPLLLVWGGLALAQQPQTPSQPPPLSTPPTFPQGQGQSRPDIMPPDTRAPEPQGTPSRPESAEPTTVEGCLSSAEGDFILTDSSGTSIPLQGDTAQLQNHVGELVRVTGRPTSAAHTSDDREGKSAAAAGLNALNVDSVKRVSKTCTPSQSAPER